MLFSERIKNGLELLVGDVNILDSDRSQVGYRNSDALLVGR
jgi:hypothetical protein